MAHILRSLVFIITAQVMVYCSEQPFHHQKTSVQYRQVKPIREGYHEVYSTVFHDVSPINLNEGNTAPDYFRDILRMIQLSNAQTVYASQVVEQLQNGHINFPKQSVLLTFDDGWVGNYDFAFPILQKFGMKAAAFVQTADVGRHDRCSWNDLRHMVQSGVWEVHSHSTTHPDLTSLSKYQLQNELSTSFQDLKQNGFHYDLLIAYPFGSHSPLVRNISARTGYKAGFAACPVIKITEQDDIYELPRSTICQLFNQPLVCAKLGLDLNQVRRDLAIFDESEGEWIGSWKKFHVNEICEPGLTVGQFGYRFAVSNSPNAVWKKDISIETPGYYSLSTWTPVIDIASNSQFVWSFHGIDNQFASNGMVQHCKPNGWTRLGTLWLEQGKYELILENVRDFPTPFIVDAVKIERIMK